MILRDVALVVVHESVEEFPWVMGLGVAEMEQVGAEAGTHVIVILPSPPSPPSFVYINAFGSPSPPLPPVPTDIVIFDPTTGDPAWPEVNVFVA